MKKDVVAFQGVKGANSEQAIRMHFGDSVDIFPCDTLTELFRVMDTDAVDYILLPVENAFAGAVTGAYELLMDHDLRIQTEIILHVHHALMSLPGTKLDSIKTVRSHPQALAQCERYIKRHNMEAVEWYDTAGAARDLAESQEAGVAAIANPLAAELYNLEILEYEIEDVPFNFTRFFLLGQDDPARGEYNKTSLVFATRNLPGALYDCLGEFARRELNLTKLDSRPRRNRPWEPVFYLDFEGHWQDPLCQEALTRLLQKASFVKMLGSYPAVKSNSVGM